MRGEDARQHNDYRKKHQKIINSTGTLAAEVMVSGLNAGLTPHSRPWFVLKLPDEDLSEYAPVREFLHMLRDGMMAVLNRSNFYSAVYPLYDELGLFGTGPMIIDEDIQTVIRCRPLTIGEYALTLDANYKAECLYRQFMMTSSQIWQKFGQGEKKMEGLPPDVLACIKNQEYDKPFEIVHVITPAEYVDLSRADYQGMAYRSIYFPLTGDENYVLRESGYRSIPFVAPRWRVDGVDTYGRSRAMDMLGDVKMLQKLERDKLEALDKVVRPPMNAPAAMRKQGGTIIAGGVNYIDVAQGQQSFTPAFEVRPDLPGVSAEIANVEKRIRDGFYNNLFLAVLNEQKDMTAYEVAKRYEEKASVLGPIMEKLDSEFLNPLIDRVFGIMEANGLLPPIPQEIPAGMPLKIEYISLLAQAQKMVEAGPIEQFVMFVGNLAKLNPAALDKVDFDEIVDQYGGSTLVPPKIIRSDDKVKILRTAREQAQRMQMMAEHLKPAADAVKSLGTTPLKGGDSTALDTMMQNAAGAAPAR